MWGLALLTFVLPWVVMPGTANPYLEAKELLFVAGGWGLVLWRHFRPVQVVGQWRNPWTVWVAGWVAGISLWKFQWLYLHRLPGSPDYIYNAYAWVACLVVLLALLLAEALARVYLATDLRLHQLTQWMCMAGVLAAGYGCCQALGFDQWFHADGKGYTTNNGVFGGFGNTGYFAIYLACLLPLYGLFASRRYLLFGILLCVALWLSRASFAWGIASMGLMVSLMARWWTRLPRWGKWAALLSLLLLGLWGGSLAWQVLQTDERLPLWKAVLPKLVTTQKVRALSMTGYGLDSFPLLMGEYYRFAHNEWVQLVAEIGVIGTGLVAAMVGWSCWQGWRRATRSLLVSGWFGVWIAFLAASCLHFPGHLAPIAFVGLCAWAVMEREGVQYA